MPRSAFFDNFCHDSPHGHVKVAHKLMLALGYDEYGKFADRHCENFVSEIVVCSDPRGRLGL